MVSVNIGTGPKRNRIKMMRFILLFSISVLQSQSIWVQDIDVSSKKNGVFIKVRSDKPLNPEQVAGWFNESTSWYYMTLHEADGDTSQLEKAKLAYPVKQIECIRAGESLQIGLRLASSVEQSEFYYASDPPELLASLRFPISDVLASIAPEKQPNTMIVKKTITKRPIWIRAAYFVGAGLTGAGFLSGETQKGWEVPVGMGIIAVAYVAENFIIGERND